MYPFLLFIHSILRWLVLGSLVYATGRAWQGYRLGRPFTRIDHSIRHWTATIAHLQLVAGCVLYFISPVNRYFLQHFKATLQDLPVSFFGSIHMILMLAAVVCITLGSSLAKRRDTDRERFGTMVLWFGIALLLILIAIPWPFSPLAQRPYIRTF